MSQALSPQPTCRHRGAVAAQDGRLREVPPDTASFFSDPVILAGENSFSLLMPGYLSVVQGKNPDRDRGLRKGGRRGKGVAGGLTWAHACVTRPRAPLSERVPGALGLCAQVHKCRRASRSSARNEKPDTTVKTCLGPM